MQAYKKQLNPEQRDRVARALRKSTEEMFGTMLGLPVESGTAYVETTESHALHRVVGLIGLAGDCAGTGRLSCSEVFACRISSLLLATECHTIDHQVLDAFAEVTNIIIGNAKSLLENELGEMRLSIPTVIVGEDYEAHSLGGNEWTVVPFLSGGERLDVKLCLLPALSPNETARQLVGGSA